MKRLLMAAALALAALAPAVAPAPANVAVAAETGLPPPTPAGIRVHIRADKDGQIVQVPVNRRFAVELVGVPTAGYQWTPTQMPAFLTRVGNEVTGPTSSAQNQPGFTGGNHWEVYVFAAIQPGSGDLVLEQRRPWEQGAAQAGGTFRVTIVAQ